MYEMGPGPIQKNASEADVRESKKRVSSQNSARASQEFSQKMAQFKRTDAFKYDEKLEGKKAQFAKSLLKQLATTKEMQEGFLAKQVWEKDNSGHQVIGLSVGDVVRSPEEIQDDAEFSEAMTAWLVETVKVRVNRTPGDEHSVTMDLSSYMPGTSINLSKTKDGFTLNFETQTEGLAMKLKENQFVLEQRLKDEVSPDMQFNITMSNSG